MGANAVDRRLHYNEMLKACKAGDSAARETLFAQLQVRLRLVLKYSLWGWPSADLDDILQETLLVVAEKLEQIESNPDLFALDVMRKKIGNRLSRQRRKSEVSIEPTGNEEYHGYASGNPEETVAALESAEISAAIQRAIKRLSPLCQMLFTALLENLSVADTWELMRAAQSNLQRSAFDKRLFDCRRKLRQLLAHTL